MATTGLNPTSSHSSDQHSHIGSSAPIGCCLLSEWLRNFIQSDDLSACRPGTFSQSVLPARTLCARLRQTSEATHLFASLCTPQRWLLLFPSPSLPLNTIWPAHCVALDSNGLNQLSYLLRRLHFFRGSGLSGYITPLLVFRGMRGSCWSRSLSFMCCCRM